MKYEDLGVSPIINACGTVTRLGGAAIREEALQAWMQASQRAVAIEELQVAVSSKLAAWTGAEAGLIASGAAAALTLGTAAILAGLDPARMQQLPCTDSFANEILVARDQRSGYDHAVRAAGARLVEVGMNEVVSGAGVRRVEPWEYAPAITDRTAGILYVQTEQARPRLADVMDVAREHGLPVIVDAAGELPPPENIRKFVDSGADLIAWSGGKAIGGPQASGILLGKRDLVGSALLQMLDMDDHPELWKPPPELLQDESIAGMPRHGIGRAMKVSKETIMALMTSLELFLNEDHGVKEQHAVNLLNTIHQALAAEGISAELQTRQGTMPRLHVSVSVEQDAFDVCQQLRNGDPRIFVGHGRLDDGILEINTVALRENEVPSLIQALVTHLGTC